jgi:hypothetical protein
LPNTNNNNSLCDNKAEGVITNKEKTTMETALTVLIWIICIILGIPIIVFILQLIIIGILLFTGWFKK